MKAVIKNIMQELSFKYVLHTLGVEPAKEDHADERFDDWMRNKVISEHYSDNDAMCRAYQIIRDNNN